MVAQLLKTGDWTWLINQYHKIKKSVIIREWLVKSTQETEDTVEILSRIYSLDCDQNIIIYL